MHTPRFDRTNGQRFGRSERRFSSQRHAKHHTRRGTTTRRCYGPFRRLRTIRASQKRSPDNVCFSLNRVTLFPDQPIVISYTCGTIDPVTGRTRAILLGMSGTVLQGLRTAFGIRGRIGIVRAIISVQSQRIQSPYTVVLLTSNATYETTAVVWGSLEDTPQLSFAK